jgi:hypothetical protein
VVGLGAMEFTLVAVSMSGAIGWLPIAVFGLLRLRAAPAASLLLIAAGALGCLTAIVAPLLHHLYWATAGSSGVADFERSVIIVQTAHAVVASVPWIVLLAAILRTVLAIPRREAGS